MKIGLKIQNPEYWKSSYFFMKMFQLGMEHTWDTNFEMDINQQILADQFNKMIPDMYSMIQWGINHNENVIKPLGEMTRDGDGGVSVDPMPTDEIEKKLTYDEIKIGIDDILIDQEVDDFIKAHTNKMPNSNYEHIECGHIFFVYDTVANSLTHY